MKMLSQHYLIIIVISLLVKPLAGQIYYGSQFANTDFEEWGSWKGHPEPTNWHGFKSGDGPLISFTPQCISQSTITRPHSRGNYSVKLVVKKTLGIKVNGTLVNGRMYAGSMSANGVNNYIYTERANLLFNTPLREQPDSITVWFCFKASSSKDSAFIHCAIHDNADFRLVSNGTYYPLDKLTAKGDGYTSRTCDSKSADYVWKRMSVPFIVDKECASKNTKYIIASFSTNYVAGRGSEGDELYVDDALLIYNPRIETGKANQTIFYLEEYTDIIPVTISYTLEGTMSPYNLNLQKNKVIVELSDKNGNFSSNTMEIGSITSDTSGTISCNIQKGKIAPHGKYLYRIRTTNYAMTANPSTEVLTFK